jgi:hypothetical protein
VAKGDRVDAVALTDAIRATFPQPA